MTHIYEFFGYRATDQSLPALEAAETETCPFIGATCTKFFRSDNVISGACTVKQATRPPVICCPNRLYADDYRILRDVANTAFGSGLELTSGPHARAAARSRQTRVVGVFGKRWGGEVRLPKRGGKGGYFVDWILALVNADGSLEEFVAVEVQTIDTSNNYRRSFDGLKEPGRQIVESGAGLNWENVNKRIIPQLIYKGSLLQREEGCKKGIFFVCPTPVLNSVIERLGGKAGLLEYALQPASITFLGYDLVAAEHRSHGQTVPLELQDSHSTTVYKMQDRFGNVDLPRANVYKEAIEIALGEMGSTALPGL